MKATIMSSIVGAALVFLAISSIPSRLHGHDLPTYSSLVTTPVHVFAPSEQLFTQDSKPGTHDINMIQYVPSGDYSSIRPLNFPSTLPPSNSLFFQLLNQNKDLERPLLQSRFAQGVRRGDIDPRKYGGWVVSDAYYGFRVVKALRIPAANARRQNMLYLASFLDYKIEKLRSLYKGYFGSIWHLTDERSIAPSRSIGNYVRFIEGVSQNQPPIYALIAELPCEVVWPILANKLDREVSRDNPYRFWVDENKRDDGGFRIANAIEEFRTRFPGQIDHELAAKIFRTSYRYEIENFNSI